MKRQTLYCAIFFLLLFLFTSSATVYAVDCDVDGHTYEITIIASPTSEVEGERLYICEICGHSFTESIPKAGHYWSDWEVITPPRCNETGIAQRICTRHEEIHYEYQELPVDPMAHQYELSDTKEATCEENGELTYTCTTCLDTYSEFIPAFDHQFSDWRIEREATETVEGLRLQVCAHDQTHRIEAVIPQLTPTAETPKSSLATADTPMTETTSESVLETKVQPVEPETTASNLASNPASISLNEVLVGIYITTFLVFVPLIYYDYLVIWWALRKRKALLRQIK